ncbi:MAG: hypothetical protein LBJ90_00710 [Treponema sp.]|jgi:hypothetical protein|nr:hypothetical protein [Treponema sp.]
MEQDDASLLKRLRKPSGPVDVVLDTDAFNEIDDQYALAFLIKVPEKLRLKAVYAAPFFNKKSAGPGDGMEKSYDEIKKILALMKREDLGRLVKKGSPAFLPSETEPVDSPAARSLAELAMTYSEDRPLYVIAHRGNYQCCFRALVKTGNQRTDCGHLAWRPRVSLAGKQGI